MYAQVSTDVSPDCQGSAEENEAAFLLSQEIHSSMGLVLPPVILAVPPAHRGWLAHYCIASSDALRVILRLLLAITLLQWLVVYRWS